MAWQTMTGGGDAEMDRLQKVEIQWDDVDAVESDYVVRRRWRKFEQEGRCGR